MTETPRPHGFFQRLRNVWKRKPRQQIFISYRRADTADITGRIYDRMIAKFGMDYVFKDVDNIPLGTDFRLALKDTIQSCNAVLVIIGQEWMHAHNEEGTRRLDDPDDFVRIEVESALQRHIPVVPVLVRGAAMPDEDDLPASLKSLAFRNGMEIRGDPYFHSDVDRLLKLLNKQLLW